MRQTLTLARQGDTHPNPRVGCVIVREGQVLSVGYHHRAGQPHAEVEALRALGHRADGATLYVNLEPCSHFGRTPPCVDAIIGSGVTRVVAAMTDPNPLVRGQGFARLRAAGIEVQEGVLADEARSLNQGFCKAITTGLPWVTLKMAATLDGKTATRTGESRWITSSQARALVHRWRYEHDAVLVGAGTVAEDDPLLTCRVAPEPDWLGGLHKRPPVRVILDSHLRLSPERAVFGSEAPTWVVCGEDASAEKQEAFRARGVQVLTVKLENDRVCLPDAMRLLAHRGISYVLAEPGATLAGALVEQKLVDSVKLFFAPKLFGGLNARSMLGGLGVASPAEAIPLVLEAFRRVGPDLLVEARLQSEAPSAESTKGAEEASTEEGAACLPA